MAYRPEPPVGATSPSEELHDRSLGELLKQLSDETTRLVRQEIELAKAEVSQKGKTFALGAGLFGAAGVLGFLALAALTACLILALAHIMPAWLAALLVALVYAAVAAVLAMRGKQKVKEATPAVPEQTVETLKEDVQWAKTQMPSGKK